MTEPGDPTHTPEHDDESLSDALEASKKARRRTLLKALGGLAAVGVVASGVTFLVRARARSADAKAADDGAAAAGAALLRGELRAGKKLANEAHELDPNGHAAAITFLRAGAFDLIDGDGGPNEGIALLATARNFGARGATLALVALAAGIGVKNDRLVQRILEEPLPDDADEGRYAYALGAGFDLVCDEASEAHYREAEELSGGKLFLASVRRVRALLFATKIDDARAAIEKLPRDRRETLVLRTLTERVAAISGVAPRPEIPKWCDPSWTSDLPKCLRALAAVLPMTDPDAPFGQSAGLDAALDDVDTPLAALLAGRLALAAGDKASARSASQCALRMRKELDKARVFGTRIALLEGDLKQAKELSSDSGDKGQKLLVEAIDAYEKRDAKRLGEIDKDTEGDPERWTLIGAATTLLGDGPKPAASILSGAVSRSEPWADLLAVDAALAVPDLDAAKKIAIAWADGPESAERKKRKDAITKAEKK